MYEIFKAYCEGRRSPACLTSLAPEFSWKLKSDYEGVIQISYRIIVKNSKDQRVWDSGEIYSPNQRGIKYKGKELKSNEEYAWTVSSYNNFGESAISVEESFSTGILDVDLWKAKWIGADDKRRPLRDCMNERNNLSGTLPIMEDMREVLEPPIYFKKDFSISKEIKKAIVFITAHGIYKFWINGELFGEWLAPGYTSYKNYMEYQRYDITGAMKKENEWTAVAADGWYTGKIGLMGVGNQYGETTALLMQMMIEYADGSTQVIGTDDTFLWCKGAWRYADLFVGEWYDAGYRFMDWKKVIIKEYGYQSLQGQMCAPVKVLKQIRPKQLFYSPISEMILDVGENIAGFVTWTYKGECGDVITLEHSEVLDHHGNFLQNIIGQNKHQKDVYVFEKDEEVTWHPEFTFHGFQYVRITGMDQASVSDFNISVLGTDLDQTGTFVCSNKHLSRLQENIFRSQQGNMISIPTDCPQRERAGWTGDMQVYAPTACFNMDVEAFLRKWLYNMRLEQQEDGQVPYVIPDIPSNKLFSFRNDEIISSAGWGDAAVIVPYRLYEAYGSKGILEENYEMMLGWMQYAEARASSVFPDNYDKMEKQRKERQKYLWNTDFHFGDWLLPSICMKGVGNARDSAMATKEEVATAMYAYTSGLMSKIAGILGDTCKEEHYLRLNLEIRKAFFDEYMDADGRINKNYQGLYVLALQMDMIPDSIRKKCVSHLVNLIHENGDLLDTGFLSVPFLLDVLYDNGQRELAWKLLFQDKCPSWLYEVKKGATTIWESWNNISEDDKRNNSSYNHFAMGCVGDFLYRRVLGIEPLEPGYGVVRISPDFSCGLEWVKGTLETVHGSIIVEWIKKGNDIILKAEIPPNTKACFFQGNNVLSKEHYAGSGNYQFQYD